MVHLCKPLQLSVDEHKSTLTPHRKWLQNDQIGAFQIWWCEANTAQEVHKIIASQILHIATREGRRKVTIFLVKELDYKENTEYTCLKEIPVKQRLKG